MQLILSQSTLELQMLELLPFFFPNQVFIIDFFLKIRDLFEGVVREIFFVPRGTSTNLYILV